jgi:hypothetical protein
MKFPQVYEAALAGEKVQWRIGDALQKEAEEAHAGPRGLQAVSDELESKGITYSVSMLSDLRFVAGAFPRDERRDFGWAIHRAADNPQTLDVIVKAAKKAGHTLTHRYVETALRGLREQQQEQYRREKAAAQKEKEKAEAEEEKAREKERAARSVEDRKQAIAERKEATERRRKAAEKAKMPPPKRKDMPPPDEDEVPLMLVKAQAMSNAGNARRLAEQTQKTIGRNAPELGRSGPAIIEAAMKAAAAWREVADLVRNASPNKRGHLSVVNE